MYKATAIIDCDSIIFTAFHPNKVLDNDGNPIRKDNKFVYIDKTKEEIIESTNSLMSSILTNSKSDSYIAYVKGKNTIKYKLTINPEYKQDRKLESPKFWDFTKKHLIDNWNVVEVNNIETDDAVNITRLQVPNSFICAIDSDLLGLEGINYNWRKNQWFNISKEEAYTKFWSDMICGTHNNTKGIPGKGPKYVEGILLSLQSPETDFEFRDIVFKEYINHFGEYKGIEEFYKNYFSLKVLDNYKEFVIPEITKYEQIINNIGEVEFE